MSNEKKNLSWDQFQSLGNPQNAPEEIKKDEGNPSFKIPIKVHYEKKGRGGKEAVIIRGLENSDHDLNEISKFLKGKLGVGGSCKDGEIIIQGNHREKIVLLLTQYGFTNIKKAGG